MVDYWIGEGFIDGNKGRAENQGYEIIGNLLRSCLLMEENQETVKMHDVVREMALWIASDFGKVKENFVVQAGLQLKKAAEIEKWKVARRVSLMFNYIETIPDAPESPQLITLLLQKNFLEHISNSFFRLMPKLVVLDLSRNTDLRHLPEEISECGSLQYLNLSRTRITLLPPGLLELRKLIYLNLEYTRMVESIYGISCLTNLKVLRLFVSGFHQDPCVLDELQLLENLQTLTITLSLASILEQFLSSQSLASCTRVLRIENLNRQSSEISFVATMDSLRELHLAHSDISEIRVERKETVLPLHIQTTTPFFPNLSQVSLEFCKGLRDLTWLLFAPNLTVLRVFSASELEEVINKERAEQQNLIPFQELKELRLEKVEMLKSIHHSPLPFPCLQKILVNGCSKLRKLPLSSTSVRRGDLVIEAHGNWMESLEWEDEDTKARFLPSFKAFPESFDNDGI